MVSGSRISPNSAHGFGRVCFFIVFKILSIARCAGRFAWLTFTGSGPGKLTMFVPVSIAMPAIRPTTDDAGRFSDAAI